MLDADRIAALKEKFLQQPQSRIDCRLIKGDEAVRNEISAGKYAYYNPKAGGAYAIGERREAPDIGAGALEHILRGVFKANTEGRIPDLPALEKEARTKEAWTLDQKFDYLLEVIHMASVNDSYGVAIGSENPAHGENGEDFGQEPVFHPYPEFVASVGYRSDDDFLHLIHLAEDKGYLTTLTPITQDGVWGALTIEGSKKRKQKKEGKGTPPSANTQPQTQVKTKTFIDRIREHPVIATIGLLAATIIGVLTIVNGGLDFVLKKRELEKGPVVKKPINSDTATAPSIDEERNPDTPALTKVAAPIPAAAPSKVCLEHARSGQVGHNEMECAVIGEPPQTIHLGDDTGWKNQTLQASIDGPGSICIRQTRVNDLGQTADSEWKCALDGTQSETIVLGDDTGWRKQTFFLKADGPYKLCARHTRESPKYGLADTDYQCSADGNEIQLETGDDTGWRSQTLTFLITANP
ncbi:MAG: hypothetical protein AAFV69_00240 [Pseudomonadota bacterium]